MAEETDMNEEELGEDATENLMDDLEEADGGGKLPLIIGAVVILLLAVGAGLYFTGMLDGLLGKSDEHTEDVAHELAGTHDDGHGGGHGEDGHAGGSFLEIPTITVNLSTEDGTPRYLRLTVQLELQSPEDRAAVEAIIPRVIDQFQTYLRELRVRDLRGSSGIYRLQTELLWRVNQASAPTKVKDVLFQEILIQ